MDRWTLREPPGSACQPITTEICTTETPQTVVYNIQHMWFWVNPHFKTTWQGKNYSTLTSGKPVYQVIGLPNHFPFYPIYSNSYWWPNH